MLKKLSIIILTILSVSFGLLGCSSNDDNSSIGGGGGKPVYAEPVYTWNADYSSCVGYAECLTDASLTVTENGVVEVLNNHQGNCYEEGYIEVVAHFTSPELKYQQRTFTTPRVHSQVIEIQAVEPNCFNDGYTEGSKCENCNTFIVEPTVIPTMVTHNFVNGHCNLCNTDRFTKGLKFFEYMKKGELYVAKDGDGTIQLEDTEVIIPAIYNGMPVVGICDFTFENSSVVSVEIPETVTDIGMYAFKGCSMLTTVNIPLGVTLIDACTFEDCSSLEEIVIPTGVTEIGAQAFYGTSLKTLIMPDTVRNIGLQAFGFTGFIENFYLNGNIKQYLKVNQAKIGDDYQLGTLPMVKNFYSWHMNGSIIVQGVKYEPLEELFIANDEVYKIPANMFRGVETLKLLQVGTMSSYGEIVVEINAFQNCVNLETVYLLDNVSVVDFSAFDGCSKLSSLSIYGATAIKGNAFYGTTSLTGLNLPETLLELGYCAFANSGIKFVNLPRYLQDVGDNAFDNCVNLERVGSAWYNYNNNQADRRPQDMALTSLPAAMFYNCRKLSSVVLPKSVTSVGASCFFNANPTIYFTGTETEYNKITFGKNALSTNTQVYFYNVNKYTGSWHYASNGDITVA